MGPRSSPAGLGLALVAAAAFGTSGSFATPLLRSGWSAGGALAARLGIAALVLTPFAVASLRTRWALLRRSSTSVLAYGLVGLAAGQWCFFNALDHVSVGVALLLEYCGILLVVAWMWARHGRRPGRRTLAGGVVALVGLCLVLDVFGGARIDVVGVLWGAGSALGLAVYYLLSSATEDSLPPVALVWASSAVGAAAVAAAGAVGVIPFAVSGRDVTELGSQVGVWVPVAGVAVIATALAFSAGTAAARSLGARVASFVGLAEVLFAILWAWLLLGQTPSLLEGAGGLLVLAGVVLVRLDRTADAPEPVGHPVPSLC